MKKILKILFSRLFIVIALLIVQIVILILSLSFISTRFYYYSIVMNVISWLLIMFIINRNDNPAYKILWICLITLTPVLGVTFYLLLRKENTQKRLLKRISKMQNITLNKLPNNSHIVEEIKKQDPAVFRQVNYISEATKEPVWKHTESLYLPTGEIKFEHLVHELKKAKNFIFLEYFIIEEGVMWNTILDILKNKVAEGVEVKLMYDDFGCISKLPADYARRLCDQGIQTIVFNPFKAHINGMMNNRDHRKIVVIDGSVGFTGGINLADEYINEHKRFGHWKDAGIMIKGDAVNNLTAMFLHLWHFAGGESLDYDDYKTSLEYNYDGYILPFDDNPIDDEQVGEMSYLNIINSANRYIYITTPYLVLDNETLWALTLASKSGVDVRIITPHIPDKPYVFSVTRSYYQTLIEAGVRIYEYTPGFIHSKTIVVDDQVSIVGTTNFDYRSFYFHFECGIWMYKSQAVHQVYNDFIMTADQSQEVTLKQCLETKWYVRFWRALLRVFAPLM